MKTKLQLEQELNGLEDQYKILAKQNPLSINDTRSHMDNLSKVVSRMKSIRNGKTINRPVANNDFLRELLYGGTR